MIPPEFSQSTSLETLSFTTVLTILFGLQMSVKGTTTSTSSVAQLQDSGNLVLVQDNNQKVLLWQSFDYPTDILLPKMKLCVNLIIGLDKFLTSWKSQDDPRSGVCFYNMIICGSPEGFFTRVRPQDRKSVV